MAVILTTPLYYQTFNVILKLKLHLTLFRMYIFGLLTDGGGGTKRPPSLKYLTHILQWWNLAQLHLTIEDPKKIWITWHTPWLLLTSVFFSPEISKFCYIKKYRYRLHFSTKFLIILDFLESLKICLINLVKVLMMSAKMVTPGLLNITIFWNKGYDVIISFDQSLVTVAFLWEKLSQPQFYKDLTRKTAFFERWYSSSIIWH